MLTFENFNKQQQGSLITERVDAITIAKTYYNTIINDYKQRQVIVDRSLNFLQKHLPEFRLRLELDDDGNINIVGDGFATMDKRKSDQLYSLLNSANMADFSYVVITANRGFYISKPDDLLTGVLKIRLGGVMLTLEELRDR